MKRSVGKPFLVMSLLVANFALLNRVGIPKILLYGSREFIDFDNYYRMTKDLFAGQHPYRLPYPETLGPPLVFLVFLPLAFLPIAAARSLITFANLFSLYLLSYILAGRFFKKQKTIATLFLALMLLSTFPARFSILMGQPILVTTLFLTLFLVSDKSWMKGGGLALATIIKTFLGIAAFSFIRKERKALIWFVIILVIITFLSFPVIKPLYYFDFLKERAVGTFFAPTNPQNLDYYNQSVKSTMFRLGVGELYPYIYPILLFLAIFYLIKTANFLAGVVLSLGLSPVCWQYYFVMLFPVMVVLFKKLFCKPKLLVFLGISYFLLWIEFPWLHKMPVNLVNGILASHYLLSALILLSLVVLEEKK
jgi:hypothetical protein